MNYLKEWGSYKPQKSKFPLLISLFVIAVLFFSASSYDYDREEYLTAQLYQTGGCVWYNCPEPYNEAPPEKYSKAWWNRYCNTVLGTELECK